MLDNGYYEYETVERDMFDIISLAFYGTETKASTIIDANPEYASYIILPAGLMLKIPAPEDIASDLLPPWKRGA